MHASKHFLTALLFLALTAPTHAAPLAANDFLPPVQAGTSEARQEATQIKAPEAVKHEQGIDGQPVTEATNAQDAVNAAIKHIPTGDGCEQILFPSGFGWVATGTAIYSVKPNPVATLHDQRLAYQKAYLKAKKNLAGTLNGLSTRGREQLDEAFKNISTNTDNLTNLSENLNERITERIQGLLRGYVLYSVQDEQQDQHGTVSITIVTTPRTRGSFNRVKTAALSADSIRNGLNAVLAELSEGLMPPVGGKIITVPQTGELAFVGFGSAILMPNENPAIRAKLELNAQKIAQMRARSALCGIILGDEIEAESTLDAESKNLAAEFEQVQQDDPLAKEQDENGILKLNERKNSFLNTELSKEQVVSIRNGNLPPGVTVKTYLNAHRTMAEAVAVYLPSVTAQAGKAAREMRDARLVRPSNGQSFSGPGEMPPQGASGQVSQDEKL